MEVPYEELDPGIVDVVRWLNEHGFKTVDSGDGKTKFTEDGKPLPEWESPDPDFDQVIPFPHVVIAVPHENLVAECDRLHGLLVAGGAAIEAVCPDGGQVFVQGTYDPGLSEYPSFIMLSGFTQPV